MGVASTGTAALIIKSSTRESTFTGNDTDGHGGAVYSESSSIND